MFAWTLRELLYFCVLTNRDFMKQRAITLMLCLGLATSALAEFDVNSALRDPGMGNYKAYAEFKMGHYDNARAIWEALDARDNGDAAFNLGLLYEDGKGVAANMDTAMAYYYRATENGSQKGLYRLGVLYLYGSKQLEPEPDRGRRYLSRAAALGDAQAAEHLAALDDNAEGPSDVLVAVDKAVARGDMISAVQQLKTAAHEGHAGAQTRLAWLYEAGRGVPHDLPKAAEWFQKAAHQGDGEAMYALAVMHKTGVGLVQDDQAAAKWLQKSIAAGYPLARLALQQKGG